MEIKTSKERTDETPEPLHPDRSRYLRRAGNHKIRKSQGMGPGVLRACRFVGKLALLIVCASVVTYVAAYTLTSNLLSLRRTTFYGCNRADQQKLSAMIRESFPAHMLRIDLKKLQSSLEQETWIKRAEIRRILPSDLVIYLEERLPAVIVELSGELMIADVDGVLLDTYAPKYGKLDVPVFKGVLGENAESYRMYQRENSERVRLGLRLLEELESASSAFTREISEVDLSDRNNLKILLVDDAAEIYMGNIDFLKRFRILMANMSQYREIKDQYTEIVSVDLRFDGQIIYRPRQERTAEARP
jgi:cell division septal protein FtsQ